MTFLYLNLPENKFDLHPKKRKDWELLMQLCSKKLNVAIQYQITNVVVFQLNCKYETILESQNDIVVNNVPNIYFSILLFAFCHAIKFMLKSTWYLNWRKVLFRNTDTNYIIFVILVFIFCHAIQFTLKNTWWPNWKIVLVWWWWFLVLNVTFSNISAILRRPVLVVEEAGVPGKNHRLWASNWETVSLASRVHLFL